VAEKYKSAALSICLAISNIILLCVSVCALGKSMGSVSVKNGGVRTQRHTLSERIKDAKKDKRRHLVFVILSFLSLDV